MTSSTDQKQPQLNKRADLPSDISGECSDKAISELLDHASTQQPSDFFARNIIRDIRQETPDVSLASKLLSLFTIPRVALPALACIGGIVVYLSVNKPQTEEISENAHSNAQVEMASNDITNLLIEETLTIAAQDPSIFTHDEVLALVGF